MIALVVFKQDVVFRAVLLDQRALQHQRFKFAVRQNVVEMIDMQHHLPDFFGMFGV